MDRPFVKKIASFALALCVTGGLLWFISRRVDMRVALGYWKTVRVGPIAGAMGVFLFGAFVVGCFKWYLLLKWKGLPVPYLRVLHVKLAAAALHVGLPLKLGAVTEGIYVSRVCGYRLEHVFSTITFDLLLNFMALVLLATVSSGVIALEGGAVLGVPLYLWSTGGLVILLVMLTPFWPGGLRVLERVAAWFPGRAGVFVGGLLESYRDLAPVRKLALMGIAVAMQLMSYLLMYLSFRGFGLEAPLGYLMLAVPVVFFFGALPVSVSGFGIRELLVIFFFCRHRQLMSPEQAVGASMFMGTLILLLSSALSAPLLPGYLRDAAIGSRDRHRVEYPAGGGGPSGKQ
ncbi:MAG: flippase-like domain-containing protein [Deltaproteobacteria bacterium]|nr:flippase-like domain-containing protein [Deltaproteobacteria bacterium]